MKAPGIIFLSGVLAALGVAALCVTLTRAPANETPPVQRKPARFRLGLIPERNLFEQRQAFRALADYLETHARVTRGKSTVEADPPLYVDLVTSSNYAGVLQDFAAGDVDGAFLGSLVTVLAVDRSGAQVLAKSENLEGHDTYCGEIFVRPDAPISSLADFDGKKLGAVRTTTAGVIYPFVVFDQLPAPVHPEFVWAGTHDDVIAAVADGRLDGGASKDLRIDAYEKSHPGTQFRRLSSGPRVPESAFVVRCTLAPEVRDAMLAALLNMDHDPDAKPVLAALQLARFKSCDLREYAPLYDLIEQLGPRWSNTWIEGPAPRRPAWTTQKAGG
ncbi:MAG TPA: phosphate/phosphite/phosphonate ABC transporter substrate-binding protein [Phycisphaerae bacterium]|nr:phosphate/phosphite/phosphonate ABC transporter substrate-binding protein [Phycisphaerae bacterium]